MCVCASAEEEKVSQGARVRYSICIYRIVRVDLFYFIFVCVCAFSGCCVHKNHHRDALHSIYMHNTEEQMVRDILFRVIQVISIERGYETNKIVCHFSTETYIYICMFPV